MTLSNPWLVPLADRPSPRLRWVLFPHAGAGAHIFRDWPSLLPADDEVLGVLLPGRERRIRETPSTRLDALTTALADALDELEPLPYVFYGHSLGGLLAFETARELRRRGRPLPVHLFVGARRAPHLPEPEPCHLADDEELARIILRLGGGQDRLLTEPRLRACFLPVLRADFTLLETYRHRPEAPLECPVTVFGGDQDRDSELWELLAWRSHTAAGFDYFAFDAGHFFHQTHAAQLCRQLAALLYAAQPASRVLSGPAAGARETRGAALEA